MDPISATIGGAFGFAGGLLGAGTNLYQAQKQMDFQKHMFRHRYQYTMEDMRKAGLNPILASEFGGGAAPPGASVAVENPMANVVNSAAMAARLKEEVEAIKAKKELDVANKKAAENLGEMYHWQSDKLREEVIMLRNQIPMQRVEGDFYRSAHGWKAMYLEKMLRSISPIIPFTRMGR